MVKVKMYEYRGYVYIIYIIDTLHCTGYVGSAIYTYGHLEMNSDVVTSTC